MQSPIGPATIAYLNGINCPLDFHNDCRIPDGLQQNTIMLVDFNDDNGWTSPLYATAETGDLTIGGVGAMFTYGVNDVRLNTYDIPTMDTRAQAVYGVSYFLIGIDGLIINFPAESTSVSQQTSKIVKHYDHSLHHINGKKNFRVSNDVISISDSLQHTHIDELKTDEAPIFAGQQSPFWSNDSINIGAITGNADNYALDNALVDAMRVLGIGFNFLPTIEVVTNSDTFAVGRFYASNMTADSLYQAFQDSKDVYTLMREAMGYSEYTNAQGVSVRLNPCQKSVITFTDLNQFSNLSSAGAADINTGGSVYPIICAKFTSSVVLSPGDSFTAPFRSKFRAYFEGVLQLPTPIITTRVPFEPSYEMACKVFSYDTINYPTTTAGHTFRKVTQSFVKLAYLIDPRFGAMVRQGRRNVLRGKKIYNNARKFVSKKPKQRKQQVKKIVKGIRRMPRLRGYRRSLNTIQNAERRQRMANSNNLNLDRANELEPDLVNNSKGLRNAMKRPNWKDAENYNE